MTSATFASLSVPAMDDTMEVSSSPAGNHFDGDIDIDFGEYGEGTHLTDDERMLEDGDPARPATANDEMMDDGDHTSTAPIVEEIMHDGPVTEPIQEHHLELADEELIDYDDDTFQDSAKATVDEAPVSEPPVINLDSDANTALDGDSLDKAGEREAEQDKPVENNSLHLKEEEGESASPAINNQSIEAKKGVHAQTHTEPRVERQRRASADEQGQASIDEPTLTGFVDASDETQGSVIDAPGEEQNDDDDNITAKAPPQLPGSLDTGLRGEIDGPPTPTDTGLHPVSVTYEGHEMPLFKSRAQPDGLLKDDNLASVSLAALLQECRRRLAIKTGEPISDEQEVSLGFDRLGLVLSENSVSASVSSLNDILEVYLQLHRNDGNEDIPPLSLSLTRQLKFDTSFNILKNAASAGQGMSSFTFLDSSHHEDLYQDDDAAEYAGDDDDGENNIQEEQDDGDDGSTHDGPTTHGYQDEDDQNHQGEAAHDHEIDQENHEYLDNQYEEYDENEEYPDPEDFDQELEPEDPEDHEYREDQENLTEAVEEDRRPTINTHENVQEVLTIESTVGPDAAQNDPINDAAGENIPDDLIVWDEDNLTIVESLETYADDGDGDFLTLIGDAETDNNPEQQRQLDEDPTNSSVPQTGPSNGDAHQDQLATDSSPKDSNEDDRFEGNAEHEDSALDNEAGEGLGQYEETSYDQADNLVYDDQAEIPFGEDEEQFHTAYDLSNDEQLNSSNDNGDSADAVDRLHDDNTNEDDIGFDDDFGDKEYTAASNSPLGKRSYEEHIEEEELDFDEPDSKKARSE